MRSLKYLEGLISKTEYEKSSEFTFKTTHSLGNSKRMNYLKPIWLDDLYSPICTIETLVLTIGTKHHAYYFGKIWRITKATIDSEIRTVLNHFGNLIDSTGVSEPVD